MKEREIDKWIFTKFNNPARTDDHLLNHWTKKKEENLPYPFGKFNRQAEVITYTDDEWTSVVEPLGDEWSRLETDTLIDLC
jgi:DNA methyltransferase 1-associated protein 1